MQEDLGEFFSHFFKIMLQEDNKIVAIGHQGFFDRNSQKFCGKYLVARYNSNGTPDRTFGDNGKIIHSLSIPDRLRTEGSEDDGAFGGVLQPNGKILLVGLTDDNSVPYESDIDFVLATIGQSPECDSAIIRYTAQGAFDSSFGPIINGMEVTSSSQNCNFFVDVVLQSDGKIIAIGSARNIDNNNFEFLVVRYNQNGLLDCSFGNNGIVVTSLGTGDAFAKSIALQEDGKILVTGNVQWGDFKKFTTVRYTSEGFLDATFGPENNGILVTSLGDSDDRSFALAFQDDGKMIVAGDSFDGNKFDFALVRYAIQNS